MQERMKVKVSVNANEIDGSQEERKLRKWYESPFLLHENHNQHYYRANGRNGKQRKEEDSSGGEARSNIDNEKREKHRTQMNKKQQRSWLK